MALLDPWRSFLDVPKAVTFPRLALMGQDHEPLVAEGSGKVHFETLLRTTYTLTGIPNDITYALRELRRMRESPYDPLARLRLIGTDAEGVEWSLGWTSPRIESGEDVWKFYGEVEGQSPHVRGTPSSSKAETEVTYIIPHDRPAGLMLGWYVRTLGPGGAKRDRKIELLGSTLQFRYDPDKGTLDVVASQSDALYQPYLENWIGEPLRILFGQPIYPRLVARSSKYGHQISIRPTANYIPGASWAALFQPENKPSDPDRFWGMYRALMTYVASAKDPDGGKNFEANKVTALYEEIYLASKGTRWVWALTFASAIEGLLRLIYPLTTRHPDANDKDVASLLEHIGKWNGDGRLKSIAEGAIKRSSDFPARVALKKLQEGKVISSGQFKAWDRLRNYVAHGNLVSPYSNQEEDDQLLNLSSLFHNLTAEILSRAAKASKDPAPPMQEETLPE